MVARGGVEPPTFRFSVGRSYQLSYLAVMRTKGVDSPAAHPRFFRRQTISGESTVPASRVSLASGRILRAEEVPWPEPMTT